MRTSVRRVDPSDRAMMSVWFDTFSRALGAHREHPPPFTLAGAVADLSLPSDYRRTYAYLAVADDAPAGAARVELPTRDNTHLLAFRMAVLPEHRGRGVGRTLHRTIRETAARERRTSLLTHLDLTLDGTRGPGVAFAGAHGYSLRNVEERQRLLLPVDDSRLHGLATLGAEAAGYRVVSWSGRCPDRYAQQYAALRGMLLGEAPTGGLSVEAERWDVARLREEERLTEQQGHTLMTTVALARDGSVAGHTVIALTDGRHAFQWDTLVLPSHRGHGLGIALKAANLRNLQRAHPSTVSVETSNATQNDHMRRINRSLGFVPLELCEDWQLDEPGPRPASPAGGGRAAHEEGH